jgi:ABC-type amino acid transport substrate-binding protein
MNPFARCGPVAAVLLLTACASGAAGGADVRTGMGRVALPQEQEAFWTRLQALCGQAFEGRLVQAPPEDGWWRAERLVMHVRECGEREIRIPLHVDADRSRTWVVTRTAAGLRLKHDHRLESGAPDASNTLYGGDTAGPGAAWRQEFPADAYSVGVVPARASQFWYLEAQPGDAFVYGLEREATGLRYRLEFDLTRPVEPPPAPWGAGGSVTELPVAAARGPVSAPHFREASAVGAGRITFFFVPSSGFAYRDAAGDLTGVTVELLRDFARHVARETGMDLEVQWLEEEIWSDFYGYVRDSEGGVFGIGNVTITEPRRDVLDFSPPYLRNVAVLVTHEGVAELSGMAAIGGEFGQLTALRYPGTLHEARLTALRDRHFSTMPMRDVSSNDELVSLLASGDGYFGYIDIYNYWRARQAGQPLRRHPVGDDGAETFGVILPHGSDWTPLIESFFAAGGGYAESERFQALLRRHLGDELASLLGGARDP